MPRKLEWHYILYLTLSAAIWPAAANICQTLEEGDIGVETTLNPSYTADLEDYWSAACTDLRPTCIITPSSALEMAKVVEALHKTDDLFAVKSGGHMPNLGFSSIQEGLLISTKKLNQVLYNAPDQTVTIGPGQDWYDVQSRLNDICPGRAVVGGRLGGVGVGGLLLGGGLSFLGPQYGWAANNVVNYEVVLANASIVSANMQENTELYKSLKGGGSNFGIVTSYTLQTHPVQKVWGGQYIFTTGQTRQILHAIRDFTQYNENDKASIIATVEYASIFKLWVVFLFYDGPEPPVGVFDNFTNLNPLDLTKTWDSYDELLKWNNIFILHGQRYIVGTETTPLPETDMGLEVIESYHDYWANITTSLLSVPGIIGSLAFQPLPRAMAQQARARGGDLLNFPTDVDNIILQVDFSYPSVEDDERVDTAVRSLYTGLGHLISGYISEGVLPDSTRPLYMNDAHYAQDYWGRLQPDLREQAVQTRREYDPDKFFQLRTSGGFRLG